MIHNMGSTDRWIRAVLIAPALVVVAILSGAASPLGIALLAVAAIMLATSAAGYCPLYRLFGVATCRRPQA